MDMEEGGLEKKKKWDEKAEVGCGGGEEECRRKRWRG
jgi:hypothetical protein